MKIGVVLLVAGLFGLGSATVPVFESEEHHLNFLRNLHHLASNLNTPFELNQEPLHLSRIEPADLTHNAGLFSSKKPKPAAPTVATPLPLLSGPVLLTAPSKADASKAKNDASKAKNDPKAKQKGIDPSKLAPLPKISAIGAQNPPIAQVLLAPQVPVIVGEAQEPNDKKSQKVVEIVQAPKLVEITQPPKLLEIPQPPKLVEVPQPSRIIEIPQPNKVVTLIENPPQPIIEINPKPIIDIPNMPIIEINPKPIIDVAPKPIIELPSKPIIEINPNPVMELPNQPIMELPKPFFDFQNKPFFEINPAPILQPPEATKELPPPIVEKTQPVPILLNNPIPQNLQKPFGGPIIPPLNNQFAPPAQLFPRGQEPQGPLALQVHKPVQLVSADSGAEDQNPLLLFPPDFQELQLRLQREKEAEILRLAQLERLRKEQREASKLARPTQPALLPLSPPFGQPSSFNQNAIQTLSAPSIDLPPHSILNTRPNVESRRDNIIEELIALTDAFRSSLEKIPRSQHIHFHFDK